MYPRDTLLRIVALALLLYSLLSLRTASVELRSLEAMAGETRQELERVEEENRRLGERLAAGRTDEELLRLARERLGLVLPGEKVFYFSTDREE